MIIQARVGGQGSQWNTTTFAEWQLAQPQSFRPGGIQLRPRSIYYLPQLRCDNAPRSFQPSYRIVAQPDAIKEITHKAFGMPAPPSEESRDNLRRIPSYSDSEGSLFNEIIHGADPNLVADPDDEASEVEPPVAEVVPIPVFQGATQAEPPCLLNGLPDIFSFSLTQLNFPPFPCLSVENLPHFSTG